MSLLDKGVWKISKTRRFSNVIHGVIVDASIHTYSVKDYVVCWHKGVKWRKKWSLEVQNIPLTVPKIKPLLFGIKVLKIQNESEDMELKDNMQS